MVGNHTDKLLELVGKPGAKVAVSGNARDWSTDTERKAKGMQRDLESMEALGFKPEALDLRDYFGKSGLVEKLKEYDMVWFSGGNAFILAKALKQSGFQAVIDQLIKTDQLIYGGYSAAFCVVSPSLRGVELVDDKNAEAEGYESGEIWDGYGLVDFYPIVHFRSDHPESDDVEKEYEYIKSKGIPLKTFRDGDVYLVNGNEQLVLDK
jgi:dipeptidase E